MCKSQISLFGMQESKISTRGSSVQVGNKAKFPICTMDMRPRVWIYCLEWIPMIDSFSHIPGQNLCHQSLFCSEGMAAAAAKQLFQKKRLSRLITVPKCSFWLIGKSIGPSHTWCFQSQIKLYAFEILKFHSAFQGCKHKTKKSSNKLEHFMTSSVACSN